MSVTRRGTRVHGFLRLERFADGRLKQPTCQVQHETAVIAASGRGVPVPAIYAHSEELQATLFERAPGRVRRARTRGPATATRRSPRISSVISLGCTVSLTARSIWQSCRVPTRPRRTPWRASRSWSGCTPRRSRSSIPWRSSRSHGCAGTFPRHRPGPRSSRATPARETSSTSTIAVSVILDWECAHFGDPMEDLGHLYSRAFFHPWGDMPTLLEAYTSTTEAAARQEEAPLLSRRQLCESRAGLHGGGEPLPGRRPAADDDLLQRRR